MRNMSFTHTSEQLLAGQKTVTRRLSWRFLKPGDLVQAVEKCQGLKKGESVKRLCVLRIMDVRREMLAEITQDDVSKEGFVGGRAWFVDMFCRSMGCRPTDDVTRIEFRIVPGSREV